MIELGEDQVVPKQRPVALTFSTGNTDRRLSHSGFDVCGSYRALSIPSAADGKWVGLKSPRCPESLPVRLSRRSTVGSTFSPQPRGPVSTRLPVRPDRTISLESLAGGNEGCPSVSKEKISTFGGIAQLLEDSTVS